MRPNSGSRSRSICSITQSVDIRLNDSRSAVVAVTVESFTRHKVQVSANFYVMALGAIENARILLSSDSQIAEGIGNHSGMVGRCFMEHLNVPIGRFIVTSPDFWRKDTELVPTAEFIRQNDIGSGVLSFGPNASPQSYGRLRVLKQFLREQAVSCQALLEPPARSLTSTVLVMVL